MVNIAYWALHFFYVKTLHREWHVEKIPHPKKEKKLPVVLAREEVKKLLDTVSNLKHRVMLMTAYAGGLRVSEVANLKVTDIDSKRMLIRVEQGKGKKDRYTLLSQTLLENLRLYYKAHRPQKWLFPGNRPDEPIDAGSIQRVFKRAKKKPVSESPLPFIRCGIVEFTPRFWRGHASVRSGHRSFHDQEASRPLQHPDHAHLPLPRWIELDSAHNAHQRDLSNGVNIQHKNLQKVISPLDQLAALEPKEVKS